MSGSINKVILVGNLGKDPEIRHSSNGNRIANLTLATNESWKDKQTGERKDRTEWHRIVIFNERLAEITEKYLRKGAKIYIEGQLQTRKWTDQSGQDRYTTEVVLSQFRGELTMLDSRASGGMATESAASPLSSPSPAFEGGGASVTEAAAVPALGELNDEIPF